MNLVRILFTLEAAIEAPSALVQPEDAGVVWFFYEEDYKLIALGLLFEIRHYDFLHVDCVEGAAVCFLCKIVVSLDA